MSLGKSVNIGVLGFAHAHVGMYIAQWQQESDMGVRVIAGWDHDSARAESNCSAWQLERIDNVDALLSRDDLTAVLIGAETAFHADLVELAANAGKA
ncbi:MAG: Gfo/Idh/MocA family oxidoreductase, partial [Armatimonadota bacterium]